MVEGYHHLEKKQKGLKECLSRVMVFYYLLLQVTLEINKTGRS